MVFRVLKSSISLQASSADETEYKLSDNLVQALTFRCLVLAYFAFFCCLSFSSVFFLAGGDGGGVSVETTDAVLNLKGRRLIGMQDQYSITVVFWHERFHIPRVQYLRYSSFTVDRNTTTVIWVTDGYNSSLVIFSLGICSNNIHFYWTSNHFPLSLPVGFCLFVDSVITGGKGGCTLGIFWWGCAAGTLEPLSYTRASSAKFCYPILELTPQIPPILEQLFPQSR